jgi:hypothetical protein
VVVCGVWLRVLRSTHNKTTPRVRGVRFGFPFPGTRNPGFGISGARDPSGFLEIRNPHTGTARRRRSRKVGGPKFGERVKKPSFVIAAFFSKQLGFPMFLELL